MSRNDWTRSKGAYSSHTTEAALISWAVGGQCALVLLCLYY